MRVDDINIFEEPSALESFQSKLAAVPLRQPDVGSIQPIEETPANKRVRMLANFLSDVGYAGGSPRESYQRAQELLGAVDPYQQGGIGEFLPGFSYELAQERGDELGQALATLDLIPGAALGTAPIKAARMASKSGIAALTTSKVQRAQELINQGKATAGKPAMTKKMVEPTKIPEGKIVEVRKNLNSRFDDPELSTFKAQTIHNPKKLKSGKLSEAESEIGKGSAISYDPAVTLKSNGTPIQLKVNQKARDEIASKTKPKNPMAAVRGMYDDLDIFDPDITLGFNPMRQNVFIDAQGYGVKAIKNGKATVVDNDVLVKLDNPENFKIVEDATGNQVKLFDDIEYYNVGNLPKTNNPSDVKVVKKNFEGIESLSKSKAIDRAKEMGFRTDEPVYHGTHAKNIDAFDDKFIGERDEGFFGRGFYFANSPGEASYYGPNVGEYFTRGKLLDLTPTKKNSNFELEDKKYFKFWTKELDKLDMLDEPTKKGLKTINKIDDYVDNNVKFIKSSDNSGNEGIAAYVKDPTKTNELDRIYSNFGVADKETAVKSLKDNIIDETQYNPALRKLYPDLDNILYSLSDYIRVGGKGSAELTKQAKKAGYDGIKVGDETVIFDAKNIRSVDAKFDPKKSESGKLLAGVSLPIAAAASATAMMEDEGKGIEAL